MAKKVKSRIVKGMKAKACHTNSCGGAIYGLGLIGALIYNLANATGFWNGVLGILKAFVWPVFAVMKILGM